MGGAHTHRGTPQAIDARIGQAVATELWRLASSETAHGEGLVWLLAQITAFEPDLEAEVATRRVAEAILAARPDVWAHARSMPMTGEMGAPDCPGA